MPGETAGITRTGERQSVGPLDARSMHTKAENSHGRCGASPFSVRPISTACCASIGRSIDPRSGPRLIRASTAPGSSARVATLKLVDPGGYTLEIELPADWPGPTGSIELARPIRQGVQGRRPVRGLTWHDDLGGMGAGYAAALARSAP